MIRCGHCGDRHERVATIKACATGDVFVCGWLIDTRQYDEDGQPIIRECPATAWTTARGFECEAGHEHVNAETRDAEGWDYADEEEAAGRAKYGHESRLMDGHIYMGGG